MYEKEGERERERKRKYALTSNQRCLHQTSGIFINDK